jgi:hypothetical protein
MKGSIRYAFVSNLYTIAFHVLRVVLSEMEWLFVDCDESMGFGCILARRTECNKWLDIFGGEGAHCGCNGSELSVCFKATTMEKFPSFLRIEYTFLRLEM